MAGDGKDETSSGETGSSESETESESKTEQGATQFMKKPMSTTAQSPSMPQRAVSSSEDDDSESESDGKLTEFKPLATEPMVQKASAVGKSRSKSDATYSSSAAKFAAAKRPADAKESDAKDSKRLKKNLTNGTGSSVSQSTVFGNDAKKSPFQRLWSEDDEIVILEGMIEYAAKRSTDPSADLNAFHDFIKKNLHVDVSRSQLQDKIRRLKKKYENNKGKEKAGVDKTFSRTHEQKGYELSKIVWSNKNSKETLAGKVGGSPPKNMGNVKKDMKVERANAISNATLTGLQVERENVITNAALTGLKSGDTTVSGAGRLRVGAVSAGVELFGEHKTEVDSKWRNLMLEEVEIYIKQIDLLRAKAKLRMNVLKLSE